MYSLTRIEPNDRAGDAGLMSVMLKIDENTQEPVEKVCDMPEIGWCVKVGSPMARTMSWQDWWRTSYVTEILEVEEGEDKLSVKFKTGNSTYLWTASK